MQNTILYGLLQRQDHSARNKIVSDSSEVMEDMISQPAILQEPEKTILNELKEQLDHMQMLDIGVGSGRTTQHFASIVQSYIGVDYSQSMVNVCKKRFENHPRRPSFFTVDARDLTMFPDDSFDFVLFSYNGIDCVDEYGRQKVLQEIFRVTKEDGYFYFSAHNLDCVTYCSPHFSRNLVEVTQQLSKLVFMRLINWKTWKVMRASSGGERHAIVKDGVFDFQIALYYLTVSAQLEQLKAAGFSDVRVYGLFDGKRLQPRRDTTSQWLYYLAKKTKSNNN